MSPKELQILRTLAQRPRTTIKLAEDLGMHQPTLKVYLSRLRSCGYLDYTPIRESRKMGRPRHLWSVCEKFEKILA